jgi:hypothetical protein
MSQVRLWGGPACGRLETGIEGYQGIFRVMEAPRIRVEEPIDPCFTLNVLEYHRTDYRDSEGRTVFMLPNAGEWLFRHWEEMETEFWMQCQRKPKVIAVPRPINHEFQKYISQFGRSLRNVQDFTSVCGETNFRGIEFVDGNETKMLFTKPLPNPAIFRGYGRPAQRRDAARGFAATVFMDEFPMPWPTDISALSIIQEIQRIMEREIGIREVEVQSTSRLGGSFYQFSEEANAMGALPMLPTSRRELDRMSTEEMRVMSAAIREGRYANVIGSNMNCVRRNRTTVYGGNMFRVIIENGSKWDDVRSAKLHRQYIQAVSNWSDQYVENSDRL